MNEPAASQQASESQLARFGDACAVALGAAALASLPTAWRCRAAGGSLLDGLLVGLAVWLCLLLPVALLRRRTARGWRGVVGADPPRHLGVGVALWAGLSTALLVALGALLKATTHHRGLGGAAYGVFGVAAVVAAAVVAIRLVGLAVRWQERGGSPRALRTALLVLALGPPLGLVGWSLVSSAAHGLHAGLAQAALVDAVLALVGMGLLFQRGVPERLRGPAQLAAVPLVVVLIGVGFVRVEVGAGVSAAVRARGGIPAAVLGVLEAWTDRDRDGAGAHFGGRDCDEGDPARRPGAADVPGDGLDADCDGVDGRAVAETSTAEASSTPELTGASATPTKPSATTRSGPTRLVADTTGDAASAAPERPDIVLVTLDSVGARHTSAYGYDKDTTPTLSALADKGVIFAHAFAIGTTTQRALTPLVTGRPLSASRRSADEWPTLLDENETVAERLKQAGYATAAVTSFTWLRQDRGFHQGFDIFDESAFRAEHPEHSSTGPHAVKAAQQAYEQLIGSKGPLFLWIHLFDAHTKYIEHPGIDFGSGKLARYDGEVRFVDDRLGEIVKLIDGSSRGSRTLWLVHGSHGEAFGEHGKRGHGEEVYDENIAVPLVAMAPWASPGRYETDAVSTLDIVPTLLDYAGASRDGVAGVSLREIIEGKLAFERAPVSAHAGRRSCVIDWPLKLLVKKRKEGAPRLLLFDLQSDPDERRDVSDERHAELRRLDGLRKGAEDS